MAKQGTLNLDDAEDIPSPAARSNQTFLDLFGTETIVAAKPGSDLIGVKIGLHAGACLAVTLNDRLDYFGQTVNITARVQALAEADEVVVTDDVLSLPGARELVAGLEIGPSGVELKGIAGEVRIHRLR